MDHCTFTFSVIDYRWKVALRHFEECICADNPDERDESKDAIDEELENSTMQVSKRGCSASALPYGNQLQVEPLQTIPTSSKQATAANPTSQSMYEEKISYAQANTQTYLKATSCPTSSDNLSPSLAALGFSQEIAQLLERFGIYSSSDFIRFGTRTMHLPSIIPLCNTDHAMHDTFEGRQLALKAYLGRAKASLPTVSNLSLESVGFSQATIELFTSFDITSVSALVDLGIEPEYYAIVIQHMKSGHPTHDTLEGRKLSLQLYLGRLRRASE